MLQKKISKTKGICWALLQAKKKKKAKKPKKKQGQFIMSSNNKQFLRRLGLQNTPTVSLYRGKIKSDECPGCDIKQSDSEVRVMLDLGECGVPLHYHFSQVLSVPEW